MIWYALCVQPSKELVAERLLVDEGYNIFVPIGHRARRLSYRVKRKVLVAGPYLPGYVFVGFDSRHEANWLRLMGYSMVHGVIGRDGEPWPISDPDMRKVFMLHQRPIPYVSKKQRRRHRQAGYAAEIISGPYTGKTVRVIEVSGRIEALYELYRPRLEAA